MSVHFSSNLRKGYLVEEKEYKENLPICVSVLRFSIKSSLFYYFIAVILSKLNTEIGNEIYFWSTFCIMPRIIWQSWVWKWNSIIPD